MSKQPSHIIKFMEMHGYIYVASTDSFKRPDESTLDSLKDMFGMKGGNDGK